MAECDRWLNYLESLKVTLRSDATGKLEDVKSTALDDFQGTLQLIKDNSVKVFEEIDDFMKIEESYVRSLKEQGLDLAPGYPDPEPLQCTDCSIGKTEYRPCTLIGTKETDSETSSLDWSLKSMDSSDLSDTAPRESAIEPVIDIEPTIEPEPFQARSISTGEPIGHSAPSVHHSIIPLQYVADVAHSQGITFATDIDRCLVMIQSGDEQPVKVSISLSCLNVCLVGSRELLVTSMTVSNYVGRFALLEEGDSGPTELEERYEVQGGGRLVGLSSSPNGLIAVCDSELQRITVHQTSPWSRVDTMPIKDLFGGQLTPKDHQKSMSVVSYLCSGDGRDNHLRPEEVCWIDEDQICVKMMDDKTIICVSLKYKEITWCQLVPGCYLLSSSFSRVYVSHRDPPARFTVLRADTGQILVDEEISCPGGKTLKVFPSPGRGGKGPGGGGKGPGGGGKGEVIALSCEL